MADLQGAQDYLYQITLATLEQRHRGPQRCDQDIVNRAARLDAKNIHPQRSLQECLLRLHNVGIVANECESGVGPREKMIVDVTRGAVRRIEKVCSEILRF